MTALSIGLALAAPVQAGDQIWGFIDEAGVAHLSDHRQDERYRIIVGGPGPGPSAPAAAAAPEAAPRAHAQAAPEAPGKFAGSPPPAVTAQAASPAPAATAPTAPPAQVAEAAPAVQRVKLERRYGPVRSGETLTTVARRVRGTGSSFEQVLIGLYRANPQAFQGGNLNRLRVGVMLRVPSAAEIKSVSRRQASAFIAVHNAAWARPHRASEPLPVRLVPIRLPVESKPKAQAL